MKLTIRKSIHNLSLHLTTILLLASNHSITSLKVKISKSHGPGNFDKNTFNILENRNVHLICQVEERPNHIVYWKKQENGADADEGSPGGGLLTSGNYKRNNELISKMILRYLAGSIEC